MSTFNIRTPNSRFDLIASRIKYGTDGGINVDSGALYVNGANGRVGINNTSPTVTLDISGTIRASGGLVTPTGSYDISGYYQVNGTPINTQFYPALSQGSVNDAFSFRRKDVSSFVAAGYQYTSCMYSPELNIFSSLPYRNGTIPLYSYDGNTWLTGTVSGPVNVGFYKGAYGNTSANVPTFVSVGVGLGGYNGAGGQSPNWAYSTNGIVWNTFSSLQDGSGNSYQPFYVMFNETQKVFICVCGSGTTLLQFLRSTDGINWTLISTLSTPFGFGVPLTWSPQLGYYILSIGSFVAADRKVFRSTDAVTWTQIASSATLPSGWNNVLGEVPWSPQLGVFLATPFFKDYAYWSRDGATWNLTSYGFSNANSCATWCPQTRSFFVATDNSSPTQVGAYTTDLSSWTIARGTFAVSNQNRSVFGCWSEEQGLLVLGGYAFGGGSATSGPLIVSSLKGRPPTSLNTFDSSLNNISENGLWNFQSLGRGVPVTKKNPAGNAFTVQPGENWIIVDNSAATTVTLPPAASWAGEEIMIKNTQAQLVNSASSNVVPLIGGVAGTSILSANAGRWATLVSDGSSWVIMNGVI